ncbi:hypothetical protein SAMN05660420_02025 [Desulfuromusa kysingii]|uniref:Uncharacterized protein n=1 Tax=Desulfuromusa kysingii TaxID=37625 RepID=A0A1H4AXF2_9BACT|nr:hypothetical protein [Desulfuromusa kysingii]SEA40550.1 hypothetical protein SAMN05660420_02025 [Desulfuromusa kysingii]
MATNLRVGGIHAYQISREVEPVPAYPRIDPQQPREESSHPQHEKRADKDDQATRRFMAMRSLIDKLKQTATIIRVDYLTTESELHDLGLAIAENELLDQLLQLKISLQEIDELFQQIRQRPAGPDIGAGHSLSEADNFFPIFIAGLNEYNLRFQNLPIHATLTTDAMADQLKQNGRFITDKNRLRLDFRKTLESDQRLKLDISVLVAISEVDEAGRRVILYQRPDQSYALYADKQIDLSI